VSEVEKHEGKGPRQNLVSDKMTTQRPTASVTDITGAAAPAKRKNGGNSGQFSIYDGGGYVIILPADGAEETQNLALAKLQHMRADRWIDRQTRDVFITINLFNLSTGYSTAVRLILEHPAACGLYPSVSTQHVPLGSLFAHYAKLSTLGPEIAPTIAVVSYMFWEFNQASMVSFVEYFSHFWGICDWLNFSPVHCGPLVSVGRL